jgi:hypothetical protein
VTAEHNDAYAARLTVEYPDRDLNRLSTGLRLIYLIPIGIVLALLDGSTSGFGFAENGSRFGATSAGVLAAPVRLMITLHRLLDRRTAEPVGPRFVAAARSKLTMRALRKWST